jgi:enoyl-CoA hydratase/carnithine racemase
MEFISTALGDDIGTITLDHPQERNALSEALMRQIVQARGG